MHFPLIDTAVSKLTPFYYQQITGRDTLCSFVPMRQQLAPLTTAIERWFDYHMKENTNFQKESLTWIDHMLMTGHSVLKVFWDSDNKTCKFGDACRYSHVPKEVAAARKERAAEGCKGAGHQGWGQREPQRRQR